MSLPGHSHRELDDQFAGGHADEVDTDDLGALHLDVLQQRQRVVEAAKIVREAAVGTMEHMPPDKLVENLDHDTRDVRLAAIELLGRLPSERFAAVALKLVPGLQDCEWTVRLAALEVLGSRFAILVPEFQLQIIPALQAGLADDSEHVRDATAAVLSSLLECREPSTEIGAAAENQMPVASTGSRTSEVGLKVIQACRDGQIDVLRGHLSEDSQGALLTYCDEETGCSPLIWAAYANQPQICRDLIEFGAPLESKGGECGRVSRLTAQPVGD